MPEIPKGEDSWRLDWHTWGRLNFGWENQDFNKQDYWLVISLDLVEERALENSTCESSDYTKSRIQS